MNYHVTKIMKNWKGNIKQNTAQSWHCKKSFMSKLSSPAPQTGMNLASFSVVRFRPAVYSLSACVQYPSVATQQYMHQSDFSNTLKNVCHNRSCKLESTR